MRRLLVPVALSLALVGAVPAVAGSGSQSDPSGDVFGSDQRAGLDVVRTKHGHSSGKIVHTVELRGSAPNPSSQQVPRLYLKPSNRANGTSECALFVGRHHGQLGVFICGYGERVASARIERSGSRTIRYSFSPGAIGNPRSYEWAVVTAGSSSENGQPYKADRAPDADLSYYTHQLR